MSIDSMSSIKGEGLFPDKEQLKVLFSCKDDSSDSSDVSKGMFEKIKKIFIKTIPNKKNENGKKTTRSSFQLREKLKMQYGNLEKDKTEIKNEREKHKKMINGSTCSSHKKHEITQRTLYDVQNPLNIGFEDDPFKQRK